MLNKLVKYLSKRDKSYEDPSDVRFMVEGYSHITIHSDGSWVLYDGLGLSIENGFTMESLKRFLKGEDNGSD